MQSVRQTIKADKTVMISKRIYKPFYTNYAVDLESSSSFPTPADAISTSRQRLNDDKQDAKLIVSCFL